MAATDALNRIARGLQDDGATRIELVWTTSQYGHNGAAWRATIWHDDLVGHIWSLSTDPYQALKEARKQLRAAVMGTH